MLLVTLLNVLHRAMEQKSMLKVGEIHLPPSPRSANEREYCCLCWPHTEPGHANSKRIGRRLLTRRSPFGHMTAARSKPGGLKNSTSGTDAVQGGVFQSLGNLCFRSKYSDYLWNTSILAPYRVVRVAAMTLISLILLARSYRLFVRYRQQSLRCFSIFYHVHTLNCK